MILAVFTVCYLLFLVFTSSFIDADTVFDSRALAPVHVTAIVLGCCLAWKLVRPLKDRHPLRIAFVALAIILLGSYTTRSARWFIQARRDGQGYASRAWTESKIVAHVTRLPAAVPIYSNAYDALYYLTGRPAIYLPEKVIHGTGRENQNYETELESMHRVMEDRGGLLVYFNSMPERWFLPSESDLKSRLPLTEIVSAPDGSIYELNANSANREIEPSR
jgi:hypothetical protein